MSSCSLGVTAVVDGALNIVLIRKRVIELNRKIRLIRRKKKKKKKGKKNAQSFG